MGKLAEYYIIRDTREKDNKGWFWEEEPKVAGKTRILGTKEQCIQAADYTVEGLEDIVRIERKCGFSELLGNMLPKDNELRFYREMEKLRNIPHKYILIESGISKDIFQLSVPQLYKGPPSSRVTRWLIDLEAEYGINIWFVGDAGKSVAKMIFDMVTRKYL